MYDRHCHDRDSNPRPVWKLLHEKTVQHLGRLPERALQHLGQREKCCNFIGCHCVPPIRDWPPRGRREFYHWTTNAWRVRQTCTDMLAGWRHDWYLAHVMSTYLSKPWASLSRTAISTHLPVDITRAYLLPPACYGWCMRRVSWRGGRRDTCLNVGIFRQFSNNPRHLTEWARILPLSHQFLTSR